MPTLTGQFAVAKWDETSFREVSKPAKANHADIKYIVSGDMKGALHGKYVLVYQNDEHATYCGMHEFSGSIGERSGTFFLHENGTVKGSTVHAKWQVVAESGTGDFAGVTGKGNFIAHTQNVDFELALDFAKQSD